MRPSNLALSDTGRDMSQKATRETAVGQGGGGVVARGATADPSQCMDTGSVGEAKKDRPVQ